MPRESRLTPELRDRIIAVIAAGNYRQTAAQLNAVGVSTLYQWLARGKQERETPPDQTDDTCPTCGSTNGAVCRTPGGQDTARHRRRPRPTTSESPSIYAELLEGIERAEAAVEHQMVNSIRTHGQADWRAASWWLTHKHPDRWADQTNVTVTVDPAALNQKITDLLESDDQ